MSSVAVEGASPSVSLGLSPPSVVHTTESGSQRQTPPASPPASGTAADAPFSPTATAARNADPDAPQTTIIRRNLTRLLERLGFAGPDTETRQARRDTTAFVAILVFALAQIAFVVTLTAFAAIRPSPRISAPGNSELDACALLGAWNLVWLARLVVRCYVTSWLLRHYHRRRRARQARQQTQQTRSQTHFAQQQAQQFPAATGHVPNVPPNDISPPGSVLSEVSVQQMFCPLTPLSLHVLIYKLDAVFVVIWSFGAVMVIITHAMCRNDAVLVAAATYTILSIIYITYMFRYIVPMVLALMARRQIGRPPVDKLSRAEVNRIPLVLYIPPPPEDTQVRPIAPPRAVAHGPTAPLSHPSRPRRFIFFRPSKAKAPAGGADTDVERGADGNEWERQWEAGAYPFVQLPDNLATCAICFLDYAAPSRLRPSADARDGTDAEAHIDHDAPGGGDEAAEALELREIRVGGARVQEVQVEQPRASDARTIELAQSDADGAPRPLRLLGCRHAFHMDCVDEWLVGTSGRCPVCQTAVEVPPLPTRRKWSRRGGA